ncbi:hypothetical protein PanWU01x14_162870 [Parasponia andersonii]|uniref:Uncharacterized protein n=1 Tax=Parasponia andersonii TaxID=3476 RepID=A0A2P5CD48_PARAD|nr:hypothetical protein PanWU01x14_162870 [Parasponia andersonii]
MWRIEWRNDFIQRDKPSGMPTSSRLCLARGICGRMERERERDGQRCEYRPDSVVRSTL